MSNEKIIRKRTTGEDRARMAIWLHEHAVANGGRLAQSYEDTVALLRAEGIETHRGTVMTTCKGLGITPYINREPRGKSKILKRVERIERFLDNVFTDSWPEFKEE